MTKNAPSARQHGVLDASNGYALCLTNTHAFVWQYASSNPSPETFTFALPYPSKHTSDPLPIGALVSPGTADEEPGLVVVMPVSGKISFWEHISSAATLDYFRQQRSGVEDTIHGMFSGEHVVQISRADSAGFILAFSSGRVAHLGVRDGQGKPAISVQFLRTTWGQSSGMWDSVFGGLKHALKSAVQRSDLAAARVDPSNRIGPKQVVAATKAGRLHAWRVQRGGLHEIIASVDARESILHGLQDVLPPFSSSLDFEVVDFTFIPRNIENRYTQVSRLSDAINNDDETAQHLLLLVSLSNRRQSQYALVEVEVKGDAFNVGMIRAISSYTTPINPSATEQPRLYLPRPALVAFIIFDRAVVVASLAAPPETPDSQLQEENHVLPATFEDVIDLRSDDSLEIVGTGLEEPQGPGQELEGPRSHRVRVKNPSALLMIRGIGVVKVNISEVERFASERPPEVTARDKLEQAVFYGLKDDNPLVFEGRRAMPFSDSEIAQAALQLSEDILASKPVQISAGSASLDTNLRHRGTWLNKLMAHLNAQKVTLDRETKWRLLANAEKITAAREIWKLHETFLDERPKHEKTTIVSEAIESISEENKKVANRAAGELDNTRLWFIHDTGSLQLFLPWTYQVIKNYHKNKSVSDASVTRYLYESAHIHHKALQSAREFRARNLDFYGLGGENITRTGILGEAKDYQGLPKPWTAEEFVCQYFTRLIELNLLWLDNYYPPEARTGSPDPALIQSMRDTIAPLFSQLMLTLTEYIRWSEGAEESVDVDMSFNDKYRATFDSTAQFLLKLRDYGLSDQALEIAGEYQCNTVLADLMVTQLVDLGKEMKLSDPRGIDQLKATYESKKQRLIECIDQYGSSFAFEVYRILLEKGGPQKVLELAHSDKHGFATQYLRNDERLGKISWINEIEHEGDLDKAAKTIIEVGEKEDQVWSKKIELSLGKLTLLAESRAGESDRTTALNRSKAAQCDADLERVEKELEVVRIQERIYQLLLPGFQDAVDEEGAVELAMQTFNPKVPKKYKVLSDDLQDAMAQLVAHKTMAPLTLINLLTVVRLDNMDADLFYAAIRVADLGLHGQLKRQAMRLIWRRCYIRDDWSKVNHTENMNDQAVLNVLGQTHAFGTIVACLRWRKDLLLFHSFDLCKFADTLSPDLNAADDQHDYILTPDEALGVFTDANEEPFGNEENEPSLLEKRADAMRWEDTTLKKSLEKHQLGRWAAAAFEAADRNLRFHDDGANGVNGNYANGSANGSANGHALHNSEVVNDEEMDEIS